jgi:hypothetical protein
MLKKRKPDCALIETSKLQSHAPETGSNEADVSVDLKVFFLFNFNHGRVDRGL